METVGLLEKVDFGAEVSATDNAQSPRCRLVPGKIEIQPFAFA